MGAVVKIGAWAMRVAVWATVLLPLALSSPAHAQFTWTGATGNYNSAANWDVGGGPPVALGQSASFDSTGTTTITVTGTIAPNSWTFNTGSQGYTITGGAVNFSAFGLTNNAAVGTVAISNNLGEIPPVLTR